MNAAFRRRGAQSADHGVDVDRLPWDAELFTMRRNSRTVTYRARRAGVGHRTDEAAIRAHEPRTGGGL